MKFASKLCLSEPDFLVRHLVHPSVFALIDCQTISSTETKEVNDVLTSTYSGSKGRIELSNDGIRIYIQAFYRDIVILRCAIRDRQLDGTDQTSPLTFFPNTDPACNRLPAPDFLAAELSIYSFDPSTYLSGLGVEGTIGHFIADPDYYTWKNFNADVYFSLWEQTFFLGRAPWQTAKPMAGVPTWFISKSLSYLKSIGYHRVDAVPSWFNVARFFNKCGFKFTYGEHQLVYDAISTMINSCFPNCDSLQAAWLVALQNIPEALIPKLLKIPVRWPVTHTNAYWVRMHVDLNPYTTPHTYDKNGSLINKIMSLRNSDTTSSFHIPIQLHTVSDLPVVESLAASSAAAHSPAASPSAQSSNIDQAKAPPANGENA